MRRLLDEESGQAMAEYALVMAGVMGLLVMVAASQVTDPTAGEFTFLPNFIRALQRYYDSFYIMLNLPIP